ncbi:uncharacterized protein [Typha latifolia]|uniref:uncharacterized protein isoform X2 n=1 Tax=Typha latifolia TaxID=4733 RepID=UPI003C2C1458
MMAMVEKSCEVIEMGSRQCLEATEESDGSLSFSDAEDHSWHSRCEDCQCSGASGHDLEEFPEVCWKSCVSDCSLEGDLEKGVLEIKESSEEVEKDCRICHLSLVSASPQSGIPIVLGCSCKDDLGDAHKQCAETWFKIKGNTLQIYCHYILSTKELFFCVMVLHFIGCTDCRVAWISLFPYFSSLFSVPGMSFIY